MPTLYIGVRIFKHMARGKETHIVSASTSYVEAACGLVADLMAEKCLCPRNFQKFYEEVSKIQTPDALITSCKNHDDEYFQDTWDFQILELEMDELREIFYLSLMEDFGEEYRPIFSNHLNGTEKDAVASLFKLIEQEKGMEEKEATEMIQLLAKAQPQAFYNGEFDWRVRIQVLYFDLEKESLRYTRMIHVKC